MDRERLSAVLVQAPLFADADEAALAAAVAAGRPRSLDRRAILFLEGAPAEAAFLVLQGRLKLVQTAPDGREVILRLVGPGGMTAAVSILGGLAYPASAHALEDCRVLAWPGEVLRRLLREHPQLSFNAVAILAERLRVLQESYRQLATERVEQRVARAVLRLASQAGRRTDEGVTIDLPLTRQDLAQMTGTTLFTVSRILSGWEEAGLVRSARSTITIRAPHGLVRLAEDLPDP